MRLFLFLFFSFSVVAQADPTGAGEAAIYAQLVTLVNETKTQIEEMRKTYNVTEQMKDMQQQGFVKELTDAGSAFNGMFNDINSIQGELSDWRNDPAGIETIKRDIERIETRMEYASSKEGLDKGQSYSQILRSLKNIKWLGEIQAAQEEKISGGTSDKDNEEISTSALISANKILIEQEKRKARQDTISTDVYNDMLQGVDYSSLPRYGE